MRRIGVGLLAVALMCCGPPSSAERLTASAARGVKIEIQEDLPAGAPPFPVVVLAPGGGVDMSQPLFTDLTRALNARGVAVVRFNWAYFTANPASGKQSDDLAAELEDMSAAIDVARHDGRLDPKAMVLMGKSLGSVVAARLLDANREVKGAVLLTPICSLPASLLKQPWQHDIYPGLSTQARPMAMIAGDRDPVCATQALYRMAATAQGPVRVVVVGGDHGFRAGPNRDPATAETTQRNIDLAIANAVDAARAILRDADAR